jgi:hypothetical protein
MHGGAINMSVGIILVNMTKNERLTWPHLSFSSKQEILHSPVGRLLVTSYLLDNAGDSIILLPELSEMGWPSDLDNKTLWSFKEVTETQLEKLEKQGLLTGRRKRMIDAEQDIYVWDFDQDTGALR